MTASTPEFERVTVRAPARWRPLGAGRGATATYVTVVARDADGDRYARSYRLRSAASRTVEPWVDDEALRALSAEARAAFDRAAADALRRDGYRVADREEVES